MELTNIGYQEIDVSEASCIYGGEPTTETSLAYDIGWVIGFMIFCNKYYII